MRSHPMYPIAIAILAVFAASCGDVGDAPQAKTGEAVTLGEPSSDGSFTIDTTTSKVAWKAAKVTDAHDGGFRQFSGTMNVDGQDVKAVRININTTSVYSDNEKLTGHLRSDDFFKVEEHPTATFEADSFTPTDSAGATHMVTGNLTMLGTTKSVSFPATVEVQDSVVTAKADFIINRKDWGIVYTGAPDDLIRDDVRIFFDIRARRNTPLAGR